MGGVWGQAQDSNAMAISIFKKVPGEMGRVPINYEESLAAICNTWVCASKTVSIHCWPIIFDE